MYIYKETIQRLYTVFAAENFKLLYNFTETERLYRAQSFSTYDILEYCYSRHKWCHCYIQDIILTTLEEKGLKYTFTLKLLLLLW